MVIAALKDIRIPWLTEKTGKKSNQSLIPDDLQLMDNGIAFNEANDTLDYLWYAVEEKDNGRVYRGFRVVRLLELKFIPLDARADAGLLQKMKSVLRSLYGAKVSFVYLTAGIFTDPAVGIIQCYGVSVFAKDLEEAAKLSANALSALKSAMTGAFRQMKLSPLTPETGQWIFGAMADMKHALVVVGQPDPRENAKGGSQALFNNPLTTGNSAAQQYSLQQNEILFRGMSTLKEDFLFLVMTSPIALSDISEMLIGLAESTSTWASWQNGVRGASFGISLPAILSGALMQSSAQGFGESEGTSHTDGTAHSTGVAHTEGEAHTEGSAYTVGRTHSVGESTTVTSGVATSEIHSVSEGEAHSESSGVSDGTMSSSGTSGSHTQSSGQSDNVGVGVNAGANLGVNAVAQGGVSVGGSGSYSHGWTEGVADSSGWMQSSGSSHTESSGVSDTTSRSETHATGTTRSNSVSHGTSETWGTSEAATSSQSDTTSKSDTTSESDTVSSSDGTTKGSSVSQMVGRGASSGLAVGVAPSFSLNQSYQWQFDPAILVTQILRVQQRLLEGASKEGAFYADAYAFTRTPQGKQAMMGLIPEAFHGTEDVVTGVQTRDLTEAEERYILNHAGAFSPSSRVETIPEVMSGYMDSTLLTLLQVSAYTAPGMFEMGTAVTVQESTPDFAFYPNMSGEVVLAKQWASELAEITPMPLRLSLERHFHTVFCGDTGFGKSVSAERLAYETTLKWHYRTIILDFGQGWRRAMNWAGLEGRVDVRQVFPGAQRPLRWNILQVPKRMDPGRYRSMVAELLANAGRMGPRQLGFLRRAITEVYQDCGVVSCPNKPGFQVIQNQAEIDAIQTRRAEYNHPPASITVGTLLTGLEPIDLQALYVERSKKASFAEVVRRLRKAQDALGKNDQTSRTSLEGLLLRVETFEEGEMARQYGPGPDSLPIEDLGLLGPADDPWGMVVIEGGAEMSDEFAKSAILSLLASVLYFDAVSRRRESLTGLKFPPMQIFFEEANKILAGVSSGGAASDQPNSTGGSVSEIFQTMWRDGRKYRIFLHLMAQTISELPEGIVSSCNNIFVVQTKNAKDRDMVMAHIGRSEKGFVNTEYKRYLARIPIKMAVVKLGYSDDVTQLEPMLVNPLYVPGSEPDDSEIVRRLGAK
ncbi:MAG: serine-rich protein [Anaerolineae bacterium]|nr:serine-rich protein [Anaerolineae bacterium]